MTTTDDSNGTAPEPAPALPELHKETLFILYGNAGGSRNTDIQIRWQISAVMFALNIGMLIFMGPLILKGRFLGWVTLGAQFIFLILWFGLEKRIQAMIKFWNQRLINLEEILKPSLRIFGSDIWERDIANASFTTHRILLGMIELFAFILIVILCWHFFDPGKGA